MSNDNSNPISDARHQLSSREKFEMDKQEYWDKVSSMWLDLYHIWQEIGFDDQAIKVRNSFAGKFYLNMSKEIKNGEIELYAEIKQSLEEKKAEAAGLLATLKLSESDILAATPQLADVHRKMTFGSSDSSSSSSSSNEQSVEPNEAKHRPTLLAQQAYYNQLKAHLLHTKSERKRRFEALRSQEHELCYDILGEPILHLSEQDTLSQSGLDAYANHVNQLTSVKHERRDELRQMLEQVERTVSQYKLRLDDASSLKQLTALLHTFSSPDSRHTSHNNNNNNSGADHTHRDDDDNEQRHVSIHMIDDVPIDTKNMRRLRLSLDRLMQRRNALVSDIDTLRERIDHMWTRYACVNDELHALVRSGRPATRHYTEISRGLLAAELERCQRLKQERIGLMLATLRSQIADLWSACLYDEQRRASDFAAFYSDQVDDELVNAHERYLASLEALASTYSKLYDTIRQWKRVWADFVAFDIAYSDPGRFKERSYRPLYEERERHRYEQELPRLERLIVEQVEMFESEERREFALENGLGALDYFEAERADHSKHKDETRKERQLKKDGVNGSTSSGAGGMHHPGAQKASTPVHAKHLVANVAGAPASLVHSGERVHKKQLVSYSSHAHLTSPADKRSANIAAQHHRARDVATKSSKQTTAPLSPSVRQRHLQRQPPPPTAYQRSKTPTTNMVITVGLGSPSAHRSPFTDKSNKLSHDSPFNVEYLTNNDSSRFASSASVAASELQDDPIPDTTATKRRSLNGYKGQLSSRRRSSRISNNALPAMRIDTSDDDEEVEQVSSPAEAAMPPVSCLIGNKGQYKSDVAAAAVSSAQLLSTSSTTTHSRNSSGFDSASVSSCMPLHDTQPLNNSSPLTRTKYCALQATQGHDDKENIDAASALL